MKTPLLLSTEALAARLGAPLVRVVDVRWTLLDREKGPNAYRQAHIPGAVFLDVDRDLSAPRGQGPGRHPLPGAEAFAEVMARSGIGAGTHVVAYDFGDGSTAARVWWLLRYFGHPQVSVLDGGMARWTAEGRATESTTPSFPRATFVPAPQPAMRVDADQVERLRTDPGTLVIDSRAPERYEGLTEPVDPVAGHVPGAKNHPYATNVRAPDDPRFHEPAWLRERFAQLGADRVDRVVCYCGSGVNACQNLLALELAGFTDGLLYEGSWSDWCSVPTRAMATGSEP